MLGSGLGLLHHLRAAPVQHLEGGVPINGHVIFAAQGAGGDDGGALLGRDRPHPRARRRDERTRDHGGRAALLQHGHQRLAHAKLRDDLARVERRILAEGLRRRLHRLLVAGGEGAKRVLRPVAELAQHHIGHIQGVLGDEIDAHPLGADEAHHLFDGGHQVLGRAVEQKMGFIEEEDQLGLVGVAHFGERFEEFGEHPQQEGRVELGAAHELVGGQHIDDPAPVAVGADEILDGEGGLAEELVGALIFQHQQLPLDGAHGGGGHIAILLGEFGGVVRDHGQHGAQVLQIQQQQALFVGDAEDDVEHAFLHIVEIEQARQQHRPHFREGGAHGMALLAEHIPEHDGETVGRIAHANVFRPLHEGRLALARHGQARQIALHIGAENRRARVGEALRQHLQRHRLARAGRACNKPVTIAQRQLKILEDLALADEDLAGLVRGIVRHVAPFRSNSATHIGHALRPRHRGTGQRRA